MFGRTASWMISLALAAESGCGVPSSSVSRGPAPVGAARQVEVRKASPPPSARALGPVEVTDGTGCGAFGTKGTFAGAINHLKTAAASMGADYVELVSVTEPHHEPFCWDQSFTLRGFAYRLVLEQVVDETASAEPAAASSGATDSCEPPCSPGYECRQAACAPVCNPACGEDQECRNDRTCAPRERPAASAAP